MPSKYDTLPPLSPEELDHRKDPSRIATEYLQAGFTADRRIVLTPEDWVAAHEAGHLPISWGPASEINLPPKGEGAPKITEHTEISDDDKALWRKQGHFLDEQGRRINPYAEQVTTTPGFGMFAGRGRYWEMGPNRFDNAGISVWFQGEKEPRYLMNCVVRNPKQPEGVWGVPGGFYDKNADQSTRDTALRELEEETSIEQQMMEELIDAGMLHEFAREEWPQVDRSATLHAWQEGGYHFYVPKGPQVTRLLGGLALQPKDESEKIRAIAFVPFSKIGSEEVPTMGSHLRAIQLHRRLWPEILQSM